jgi:sialate O-acetylesterase
MVRSLLLCALYGSCAAELTFSAGFTSDAVLQRSATVGAALYGFTSSSSAVSVAVSGVDGAGAAVSYRVQAAVEPWTDTSGCTAAECIDSKTPVPPVHGAFTWRAELKPQPTAGGTFTLTAQSADTADAPAPLRRVTFGDVWYCSGQSNMALETFYTFSADDLKAQIVQQGKYSGLRHFMYGSMGDHFEALGPQWVTSWNSLAAGDEYRWHNATASAALPSADPNEGGRHSAWAQFSATCMYFGAELIDARAAAGVDADVPVGLIQSAIGGSQIESWMANDTRAHCRETSEAGGAVPENAGRLYYGMTAPFANYSVAGWLWYQGENNCYGVMGNSADGAGYGCELPAMISAWRSVWHGAADEPLFGIATLAAGGSEGDGQHMAGMRWSQTANYGYWDNPVMPNTFGAQVYDLGDPWSEAGDGNQRVIDPQTGLPARDPVTNQTRENCCHSSDAARNISGAPGCPNSTSSDPSLRKTCPDLFNCSLPEPATGKYGAQCAPWDDSDWAPALRPQAPLVRENSPSGVPGLNFMGGIHPRLKRPVGRRLAYAAVQLMKKRARRAAGAGDTAADGAEVGPLLSGCSLTSSKATVELRFNATLLGGEGLMLRPFDANATGSWGDVSSPSAHSDPSKRPVVDSNGLMVCTVDATAPETGNASTCHCQGWNYIHYHNNSQDGFWYCEVGPGWKPTPSARAAERARRAANLSWVPGPPIYRRQWRPAPLVASSSPGQASVDLSAPSLQGRTPVAIRLAWPLFSFPYSGGSDTCCPSMYVQGGRGICLPGNCPLYSSKSELPAQPFFATIDGAGSCSCMAPQQCTDGL